MAPSSSDQLVDQKLEDHGRNKEQQQRRKIPQFVLYFMALLMVQFLIYIVLQWVVIIVMFLNGVIAFVANEFARFFNLRIPCFLCTRIDHVLLRRNLYYNDSICEDHRKEVSSLVFCHIHRRLSDIRFMCERCFLSFTTENKTNSGLNDDSQVGILGSKSELSHLRLPIGGKGRLLQNGKNTFPGCSCCGQPQGVTLSSLEELDQNSLLNDNEFPRAPTPSPRGSVSAKNDELRAFDPIRQILSDTESEIPDEEYGSNALTRENQGKEDMKAATVPLLPDCEDLNEESSKTPTSMKTTNRFSVYPFTDTTTTSSKWPPKIPRRSPTEKSDSGTESVDGNSASEADSESILHHLKRQVRLDRKTLIDMYMELDEERSSSAVAVNHAMAMITRLQAEKAAIQMEALQYQRIMEEQAEYDQESLQILKDLLSKREEEIKNLEIELRSYRESSGDHRIEGHKSFADDYQHLSPRLNSPSIRNSKGYKRLATEDSQDLSPRLNSPTSRNTEGYKALGNEDHQDLSPRLNSPTIRNTEGYKALANEDHQDLSPRVNSPTSRNTEGYKAPGNKDHQDLGPRLTSSTSLNIEGYNASGKKDYQDLSPRLRLSTSLNIGGYKALNNDYDDNQDMDPTLDSPASRKYDIDISENELNPFPIGSSEVERSFLDFEEEWHYSMDQLRVLENKIQSSSLTDLLHPNPSNLEDEGKGEGSNTNSRKPVSHLYEKLMLLERDREFIKRTLLSLKKGDEGIQVLREIAKHLQDLWRNYNMISDGLGK